MNNLTNTQDATPSFVFNSTVAGTLSLPVGVYALRVESSKGFILKKLIKK